MKIWKKTDDKEILMSRERVLINHGKHEKHGKDTIIVTVKHEKEINKRHIVITVPFHMNWPTILKALKNLPKHLENERKKKKKSEK